jgi:RimJ/RimL family protein N-acetyltransferase
LTFRAREGRKPRIMASSEWSVASEYRRQGVGTALLEALTGWCRSNGASRLELQVCETNGAAIRLYERMGFEEERRRRKAAVIDGEKIDVLLMARVSAEKDESGAG